MKNGYGSDIEGVTILLLCFGFKFRKKPRNYGQLNARFVGSFH